MATTTATICARCGANDPVVEGACTRCGTPAGQHPLGPPTTARCPVCGTAALAGRATCPGCGIAIPGTRSRGVEAPATTSWVWWQVALAALGLVVLTTLVVLALGRDGPRSLEARWRVELASSVEGAPVVSGDTVLVTTTDGTLVAIEARGGAPRWRLLTEQQVTAPLAARDDLVVVATTGEDGGGHVFGVDLRTGQERWRVSTDAPVTDAPVIDEQSVYLARGDVSAHDVATGEQRWRRPTEGGAGALAIGGGTLVVVDADGVVALSTDSGEQRWSSGGGRPEVAPGIVGDLALIGDGTGAVVARALDRGQERWRVGVGGQLLAPVVAGPDVAVVVTTRGIVALAIGDGTQRWQAGPARDARLRVGTGGTAIPVRTGSGVLLLDGLTGEVLASARLSTGDPDRPAAAAALTEDIAVVLAAGEEVTALR